MWYLYSTDGNWDILKFNDIILIVVSTYPFSLKEKTKYMFIIYSTYT